MLSPEFYMLHFYYSTQGIIQFYFKSCTFLLVKTCFHAKKEYLHHVAVTDLHRELLGASSTSQNSRLQGFLKHFGETWGWLPPPSIGLVFSLGNPGSAPMYLLSVYY